MKKFRIIFIIFVRLLFIFKRLNFSDYLIKLVNLLFNLKLEINTFNYLKK